MQVNKGQVLTCKTNNPYCEPGARGVVVVAEGSEFFDVLVALPNRTLGRYTSEELSQHFRSLGEILPAAANYHYRGYMMLMSDIEEGLFEPLELG